jgi:hypothetical protein
LKVKSTAALLVALTAALGSCGGDDAKPSASRTTATGPTGVTQPADKDASPQTGAGTGGAKPPKSDGGPASKPSENSNSGSGAEDPAERDKPRKQRTSGKKGTATTIEELSPAEREKLHKDLYTQGKNLCSAYTPAQLAQQYNITATRPEDVARKYAELYEQGNPSLVLPYQQGCLAGFKKRARKTRNAGDATGG